MKYNEAIEGQKVQYQGCRAIGKCTGTIIQIFAPDPLDAPFDVGHAIVEVDELPHPWPYLDNDFAPSLGELELME